MLGERHGEIELLHLVREGEDAQTQVDEHTRLADEGHGTHGLETVKFPVMFSDQPVAL